MSSTSASGAPNVWKIIQQSYNDTKGKLTKSQPILIHANCSYNEHKLTPSLYPLASLVRRYSDDDFRCIKCASKVPEEMVTVALLMEALILKESKFFSTGGPDILTDGADVLWEHKEDEHK